MIAKNKKRNLVLFPTKYRLPLQMKILDCMVKFKAMHVIPENKITYQTFVRFRFRQLSIITEDLGTPQSTLLSGLFDSPDCDWSLLHQPKTNYLL